MDQIEFFVRFDKDRNVYLFRMTETAQPVEMDEDKATKLLASVERDPAKHKVLKFLFEEAKKDPKGTWVSASSAPIKSGQALV